MKLKSKNKKNLRWIDLRKYCLNKKRSSAIEKFIDENYLRLGILNPEYHTQQKKTALNVIISNAVNEYITGKFIAVPFYRGYYKMNKNNRLKYNTYQFIVGGVKVLIENGYLELRPGTFHYLYKEDNTVSSIRASRKLIDEIKEYTTVDMEVQNYFQTQEGVTYIFSEDEFDKIEFDCVVELKDKHKRLVDYRPNVESERSRKFLREYNLFIKNFDVKVPINEIDTIKHKQLKIKPHIQTTLKERLEYETNTTTPLIGFSVSNYIIYKNLDCRLKRVFNDERFYLGGRFYEAEYQMLSEKERGCILIDGEDIVEIDYKSFHPRMLYHELGIDIKGDLYEMVHPEKDLKRAIKKMLNILINSKSDVNALKAFEDFLAEDDEGEKIKIDMEKFGVNSWDLIKMIKEKHKPISKFIGSGIGKKKQYEDSNLAKRIMKHFIKKEIACLCIHDSFIVQKKYTNELYDLMIREYEARFGFKPELEINKSKEKK